MSSNHLDTNGVVYQDEHGVRYRPQKEYQIWPLQAAAYNTALEAG